MKTDSEIKQDVQDELKWEAGINEAGIGVAVKDGIVTLSGNVDTYAEKAVAENAAKSVSGVRAVVEEIRVKILGSDKRTDEEIAKAAINCLKWNSKVPKDEILVKVEDGWLTLEGRVNWNFQREAAAHAVENLRGVKGIGNMIQIKVSVKPDDVKESIKKAIERNAILDAEKINVEIDGHKVLLTGTVQSWAELRQAGRAAWSAPGVWSVVNNLVVKPESVGILTE